MSVDPNKFLCDDFKIPHCDDVYLGYSIRVMCKNESCLAFHKHSDFGCLLCDGECKGHRTGRTFRFGPELDTPQSIAATVEMDRYICKNCGSKEFITPFDVPNNESF